mmetsp:Transcript_68417/g.179368  ORF Transcript_68417/g.179368 Transcript_68417/m.179368 type:complete len:208 (+) Transcript_68417:227-850(+)
MPLVDKLLRDPDVPVHPSDAPVERLESQWLHSVGQAYLVLDGGLVPSPEDGPPVKVPVVEGREVQGPISVGLVVQRRLEGDGAHPVHGMGDRLPEAEGAYVVGEIGLAGQPVGEEVWLRGFWGRLRRALVDEQRHADDEGHDRGAAGRERAASSPLPAPSAAALSLGRLLLLQAALQEALRINGKQLDHGRYAAVREASSTCLPRET